VLVILCDDFVFVPCLNGTFCRDCGLLVIDVLFQSNGFKARTIDKDGRMEGTIWGELRSFINGVVWSWHFYEDFCEI